MQTIEFKQLLNKIEAKTDVCPVDIGQIGEDQTYEVPSAILPEITQILAEEFGCTHLSTITAQQRKGKLQNIEVLYHFWQGVGITILIKLPAESPQLPSIISILPGADFYEREAAEMFGIVFTGRQETPPLLLPDDWAEGPPFIRKEEKDG